MPARRGDGLLAERPDLFVAGVAQAFGARRNNYLARVEASFELKTQVLQPVEVLDTAVAVGADLLVIWLARHRDQILVHLLGGVGMPGRLLDRGAAAEVKVAAGKGSGAAGRGRALQHQYPCSGGGRGDRGATAADAEADHHDVHIVRPGRHIVGAQSCWNISAHWRCSCLM